MAKRQKKKKKDIDIESYWHCVLKQYPFHIKSPWYIWKILIELVYIDQFWSYSFCSIDLFSYPHAVFVIFIDNFIKSFKIKKKKECLVVHLLSAGSDVLSFTLTLVISVLSVSLSLSDHNDKSLWFLSSFQRTSFGFHFCSLLFSP